MLVAALSACSGWAVDTIAAAHDLRPKRNASNASWFASNATWFNTTLLFGAGVDGTMLTLWPRDNKMSLRAKDLLSLHEPADPDGWVRVAVGSRRQPDDDDDPLPGPVTGNERPMAISAALSVRLFLWALALGVTVVVLRGGRCVEHRGIMRGVSKLLLKKPRPRGAPSEGFERMEYARR